MRGGICALSTSLEKQVAVNYSVKTGAGFPSKAAGPAVSARSPTELNPCMVGLGASQAQIVPKSPFLRKIDEITVVLRSKKLITEQPRFR